MLKAGLTGQLQRSVLPVHQFISFVIVQAHFQKIGIETSNFLVGWPNASPIHMMRSDFHLKV